MGIFHWRKSKPKGSPEQDSQASPQPPQPAPQPRRELLDLQRAAGNQSVGKMLHGKQTGEEAGEEATHRGIRSPGKPLDETTRAGMENALGQDFRQVRVHTDSEAGQAAQAQGAQAFTAGQDIVFGQDQYAPRTQAGKDLLAHELSHVVQQQGAPGARSPSGLEAQAEQAASAVSSGRSAQVAPVGAVGIQRRALEGSEERRRRAPDRPEAGEKPKEKSSGGFFSSLWSGVRDAGSMAWGGLKSAGGAIWSGMKTAGSAIWSGLKTAGSAVWKGMKTVGGWIGRGAEAAWAAAQWVGRALWDKLVGVFGRLGRWVEKLPSRIGRLFNGLLQGLLSLKPWSLDWWKSLLKADTWLGLLKWLGARLVDLLEIFGLGEIYETVMDFIKINTRALTSDEVRKASGVFGASIDYRLVRIDERAVLGPSFSHREYTSFHTINGWGGMTDDTLMHELTHVWQYEQSGAIYMPQAIHAQVWGAGYDYGGVAGLTSARAAGQGISSFNREQQAQIVTNFYRIKHGMAPDPGAGTTTDLPLYAHFVKDVSTLTADQLVAK